MSIIYQPSGKAREYSPLAINIYTGCNHQCKYCYAPSVQFKTRESYTDIKPRRNIISELEKDCKRFVYSDKQVLFCFMTDPYNSLDKELRLTREALKLMLKYHIPVSILSKAGPAVIKDIDIIKKFGKHIQVGATLTMDNVEDSLEWEPYAATPEERILTLKKLKSEGVRTWASFEPVLDIDQSLNMMQRAIPYVDVYKIGKLNNYKGMDKKMDWTHFLSQAVEMLRSVKKPFYVKYDLRQAAPSVKLYGNETSMDEHNLPPFEDDQLSMGSV